MEKKKTGVYDELAIRLSAAYVSWRAMNNSIDYTMKKYCNEPPNELWLHIAKYVDDIINKAQEYNESKD